METTETTNSAEPTKRPVFLTVLCILTYIWSGITCFASLITPLISDMAVEAIQSSPTFDESEMKYNMAVLKAGWEYHAPIFLMGLLSLVGAILMWNLKKIGFHLYTAANIAILFIPTLIIDLPITIAGVLITLGFIIMYAVNLKNML